jgi:hypothetical protein
LNNTTTRMARAMAAVGAARAISFLSRQNSIACQSVPLPLGGIHPARTVSHAAAGGKRNDGGGQRNAPGAYAAIGASCIRSAGPAATFAGPCQTVLGKRHNAAS